MSGGRMQVLVLLGLATAAVGYGQSPQETTTDPLPVTVDAALAISTGSLPNGTVGQPYAASLAAKGGTEPYGWLLNGLPGVSVAPFTGVVSGTPTQSGTFRVTARVIDRELNTDTQTFNVTIAPALNISTTSLPNGTVGSAYSGQATATGGTPPYKWNFTGLPAGITFTADSGALSGTPTQAGTFNVTATVTDKQDATASQSYPVTISPPPLAISTASLAGGTVGVSYTAQVTASGGAPPYTWTFTGLPPGLGAAANAISGMPTQPGTSTVTARVTDSASASVSRSYSLVIAPAPLVISTASLPDGTVGTQYAAQLGATGGTTPYTWTVTGLPPGVTANGNAISGSPTAAGTFPVTAGLTDAAGVTASKTYSVTIAPAALVISTTSLPDGTAGTEYTAQVSAAGGTPPYSWAITGLPAGVTASGNAISGTPTQAGAFNVTAKVTDNAGVSASKTYAITIAPAALAVSTPSLPDGTVGAQYSAQLGASGGTAPYTWAITGLPAGLTASGNAISGTPTQAGAFNVTAKVTDNAGVSASKTYAITIAPAALAVSTPSLPDGTVGAQYSAQLGASGGTAPYTWTITGLPAGLTASGNAISGTPTQAGVFNVTAKVTDNAGVSASKTYAITIAPAALAVSTPSLPDGTVGSQYSAQLAASGGTAPYTWTITGLPAGVTASGNAISGTPTQAGAFNVTARVTDNAGVSASKTYAITIAPATLAVSTPSLPDGTVGAQYSAQLAASGGTAPYTWTITGLPAGVTASGNAISGTPTQSGPYQVTARVSDSAGSNASRTYSITVAPAQLLITTASLPDGTMGGQYAAQLTANGGTPPYSWSITGLPAGVSANASGAISGSPTQSGPAGITARVTDSAGVSASRSYSVTIAAPSLSIATNSLADGMAGAEYTGQLNAAGGAPPYTWSVTGLPAGLAASPAGILAGTPAQPGSYDVNVRVSDGAGGSSARTYTLRIAAAPVAIANATLPDGASGAQYAAQLSAIGGTPPYSWSITGLPPGVNATGSGAISGTPSQAGSFNVSARVTDSAGVSATRSYAVTVAGPALAVATTSLPDGKVGTQYSTQLNATGGTPPHTWAVTGLPPGLTAAATGAIGGTPAAPGPFNVSARVTDSAGANITRTWQLNVAATPVEIGACPAATTVAGQPYSSAAGASGGVVPYSWAIAAGQLPPGITLNTGTGAVAGTASQNGNFNFTMRVTDAAGSTASRVCAITVAPALSSAVQSLPGGVVRTPYAQRLTALGGVPPYRWSVTAGALPPGLNLDAASGILSGTPLLAGRYTFRARATDQTGAFIEADLSITIATGLSVTACSTETGSPGRPYASSFQASGGETPYSWQLIAGSVPAGLVLDTSTGAITGIPQTPGTATFTVRVTDRPGTTATRDCSIRISPPLAISGSTLPAGNVGVAYSDRLSASGGVAPYTWSTVSGALAPGLFLNSGTGQITGTPMFPGSFAFTARVTDAIGATRDVETSITVTTAFSIADCPTPVAMLNQSYVFALTGAGGQAPYAWTLSGGSLPAGLALNSASGVITGTPTRLESTDFTIRAADAASSVTTRSCSLRIAPPSLVVNTARRLPDASLGDAYEATLTAAGGRPPYTWIVIDGALPNGVTLTSAGALTGSPSTVGAFMFTVQVSDQDRTVAIEVLELRVTPAALSAIRITGVPEIASPAQQMFADVEIERAYPAPITGTMRMRVTPDPGLPEDPAVQFAAGGRTVGFTIPAGGTKGVFTAGANGLQTGTVAAAVQFEVSMSAAGLDLTPAQGVSTVMRVDRLAPRITSARANRTADGLDLVITAFATTREITSATFRFTPAPGATFTQTEFTVDLRDVAGRWFADVRSGDYGSQFTLLQPFRVSGAAVSSVAVTLTNGQGTSQAATIRIE